MINNVPIKIMQAARTVTLMHPNSMDCTVYRKVLLRTGDTMGGMPTLGGLGVLKSEDEPDFEYQPLGMGKILITSRYEGSGDMSDRGDSIVQDEPMQEAQIVSIDPLGFELKKQDLIGAMPGGGVLVGFEIVGITGSVAIYPYTTKFIIAPRDELHDLQPWTPAPAP